MKFLAALPFLALPALACAQTAATPQIMTDVHNGDFTDAATLAQQTGDPLMVKLVTFFRLTDPGGGTADEINQFIAENPDWPEQGLLALRAAQAAGLPPQAAEPTPDFITQVEALHTAGQDIQAARNWQEQGQAAFNAADAAQRLMFWPDQNRLARALLSAGDAKDAYAVVNAVTPPASAREQNADRDFLAGFLLLRFLHQPDQAATWFRALATVSPAVITQARAYYWLARTESGAAATADYTRAAAYPSTFYGQLANFALGGSDTDMAGRIQSAQETDFSAADALSFGLMELPRAAVLLIQMNDTHDAVMFLNKLGQTAGDDKSRVMAAKLALGLGLPQSAVSIARSAGIAGQTMLPDGWPNPYAPPSSGLEPAVADAIMRQESSFDPSVISGAGAVGLMQLMPETARRTAKRAGIPMGNLFDPQSNMALGSAYLAQEVANFGNCLPLAIAAYNAGPTNVSRWLSQNGDPELGSQAGGADILDWIEEIPFNETRNYVERVLENATIYRATLNGSAPSPLDPWMKS
ncbi:lytic transglycosylase domain-containing protein [Acidocella aromatica]|uniref:Soluble lytic murein transglycosylase n=1 Tax=Acidocella aromatica TaxID=1303579 RepID=A0A840VA93_9PROT|nr:lytic transglycosylase domain-containing protein [Acidocella aromatica]MBB5372636.1 soluble lytic murein transglycosylase [Acidocella aromatica]